MEGYATETRTDTAAEPDGALAETDLLLDQLENTIGRLNGRLEPCLTFASIEAVSEDMNYKKISSNRVREQNDRLRRLNSELLGLEGRIDL